MFKVTDNDIFAVTKGSARFKSGNIISKKYTDEFNTTENIYNEQYPFLRTIAFSVKKSEIILFKKIQKNMKNQKNTSFYLYQGIQDELQKDVYSTAEYLKNNNKIISICISDKKKLHCIFQIK